MLLQQADADQGSEHNVTDLVSVLKFGNLHLPKIFKVNKFIVAQIEEVFFPKPGCLLGKDDVLVICLSIEEVFESFWHRVLLIIIRKNLVFAIDNYSDNKKLPPDFSLLANCIIDAEPLI
jgi:hypothetical protein